MEGKKVNSLDRAIATSPYNLASILLKSLGGYIYLYVIIPVNRFNH
jgi:hypothetical protein